MISLRKFFVNRLLKNVLGLLDYEFEESTDSLVCDLGS